MIKQEKVYPPLLNLIARCAMDKEKVIHEIKRDLRSPMVFRGLLIIGMFLLMIIYQVFCWLHIVIELNTRIFAFDFLNQTYLIHLGVPI